VSERRTYHICLIVDNPLRDIDGLVLLAWQLAQHGHNVYLTPMYDQGFDVLALMPDMVVANYARPNNIELLSRFHNAGIAIAILDTEGSPGRDMEKFAKMVGQTGIGEFVSLYCMWGHEQFSAFHAQGSVPESIMSITGCPRYDYCVAPLRTTLRAPEVSSEYVLINTSFPIANPRFTRNSEDEYKTMISIGFDKDFATEYVKDVTLVYEQTKEIIRQLVEAFPDVFFVLRPHPFENPKGYIDAIRMPNFEVRQERTSIEWLNHAKLLIHLNCITSIESMMLDVESVSLEWINTHNLVAQGPPLNVSHQMEGMSDFLQTVESVLKGDKLLLSDETEYARSEIINNRYYKIDGFSALRVSNAIERTLKNLGNCKVNFPKLKIGFNLRQILGNLLGYRLFHFLIKKIRILFRLPSNNERKQAKLFSKEQVKEKIDVISTAYNSSTKIHVNFPEKKELVSPHLFSGNSIKISR